MIVVTHHHDIAGFAGEHFAQRVLRMIGVLVFVNQQIAKTVLIGIEHFGMMLEQQIGIEQQVIEIEGVRRLQPPLIFGIYPRDHLGHRILRLLREILRDDKAVLRF